MHGQAVSLPCRIQRVAFDMQWTCDLGKKVVEADPLELPVGSETSRSHRGKQIVIFDCLHPRLTSDCQSSVLISGDRESGFCDLASISSFRLESPKGTSLSGVHALTTRNFLRIQLHEFSFTPTFREVCMPTWD
jgi:hypothetical protein